MADRHMIYVCDNCHKLVFTYKAFVYRNMDLCHYCFLITKGSKKAKKLRMNSRAYMTALKYLTIPLTPEKKGKKDASSKRVKTSLAAKK